MKRIYFVRHGITGGNETKSYQHLETPLSDKGREQARVIAERFSQIPFEVLISSTMERAHETARIIAEKTGHTVVSEGLFHETLRPSIVRGKPMADPEVLEALGVARSLWTEKEKRPSDEENFHDLKGRAIRAIEYLVSRKEERIVVVTHGTILKMIVAVMMNGEDLAPGTWEKLEQFFFTNNTGITVLEYDNEHHPKRWQLITWNDHAHIA